MIAYSVIVPAYNEESYLSDTLEALKAAMATVNSRGEIIVVDNNSTDGTADIAREKGAGVIFEKINQISRARNAGAMHARGDFFIFLDADTLIPAELLAQALSNLENNTCCGGGATVLPDKPLKPFYQIWLNFWNRFSVKCRMAAGSFIYCRKDGFQAVGGFSEKVYVGEEIWFSIDYRRWGRAIGQEFVIIDNASVITSTRKLYWFSKFQTAVMMISMMLFPFISRYRALCRFWYHRPPDNHPRS